MNHELILRVVVWVVPIVFSIVLHEVAHGWMAYRLGDPTAKNLGRLTLNPLPHIDMMGTLLLPLVMLILCSSLCRAETIGSSGDLPFLVILLVSGILSSLIQGPVAFIEELFLLIPKFLFNE